MREVVLEHRAGDEFLKHYLRDLPGGGVFVETLDDFEVGEKVVVKLVFPEIPDGLFFDGEVAWKRSATRWRSAFKPGVGVSFFSKDRSRLDFLMEFSRGQLDQSRKEGRRIPAALRLDVLSTGRRIACKTRDLSRGGVSVLTEGIAEGMFWKDDRLEVDLYLDAAGPPERFSGTVVWARNDDFNSDFGLRFEFPTSYNRSRLGTIVRELEGRLVKGGYDPGGPVAKA